MSELAVIPANNGQRRSGRKRSPRQLARRRAARRRRNMRRRGMAKPWSQVNNLPLPPPLTGFGKYTEAKGKKAYKRQKRAKKESKNSGWFDTIVNGVSKIAPHILPLIAGFGDYDVSMNSVLDAGGCKSVASQCPVMENSSQCNIIRHREFLGSVLSSTAEFTITSFPLNPGLDTTFPWLASLANSFTAYRMRGLVFDFESRATEYSANTALGFVALATNYNSLDPVFGSKREMLNYEFATSAKPSEHFLHPVECARDKIVLPQLYIRSGAVPSNADQRMYDMGKLNLAVGGQAVGGANLGDLYATYEVELLQPKLSKEAGSLVECDMWALSGTIDGTNPFGTVRVENVSSTMVGDLRNNQYLFDNTLRNGTFLCVLCWDVSPAAVIPAAPSWTLLNCEFKTPSSFFQSTNANMFPNSTGTTIRILQWAMIDLTGGGQAVISVGNTGFYTGTTAGFFLVTQVPTIMVPSFKEPLTGQIFSIGDRHIQKESKEIVPLERSEKDIMTNMFKEFATMLLKQRFKSAESDSDESSSSSDEDYEAYKKSIKRNGFPKMKVNQTPAEKDYIFDPKEKVYDTRGRRVVPLGHDPRGYEFSSEGSQGLRKKEGE